LDYERSIALAPNGWRHFTIEDIERLPQPVRRHELARVPHRDLELAARGDAVATERLLRACFWTLVYHLEPEKWDELSRCEPIHPDLLRALPDMVDVAVDIGAGSGRLTAHLVGRASRVVAVEPSAGLRAMLHARLPHVEVVAGWGECLPVRGHVSHLTTACGSLGPEPQVLAELVRVTAPGGSIVLISPEEPEWFEAHDWDRITLPPVPVPAHPAWIDEFFGPPDPPHEMVALRVR
jgi:SAM-dependent methyltransferase